MPLHFLIHGARIPGNRKTMKATAIIIEGTSKNIIPRLKSDGEWKTETDF